MSRRLDITSLLNEGRDISPTNTDNIPNNAHPHTTEERFPHDSSDGHLPGHTASSSSIIHSYTGPHGHDQRGRGSLEPMHGITTSTTTRNSSPVPETVILAPHLQKRQHGRSTPQTGKTPLALVAPLPPIGNAGLATVPLNSPIGGGSGGGGVLAGLDALVHAASVERSRLEDPAVKPATTVATSVRPKTGDAETYPQHGYKPRSQGSAQALRPSRPGHDDEQGVAVDEAHQAHPRLAPQSGHHHHHQARHHCEPSSPSHTSPHASTSALASSSITSTPARAHSATPGHGSTGAIGSSTPRTRISVSHTVQGHQQGIMSEEEILRKRYQQGKLQQMQREEQVQQQHYEQHGRHEQHRAPFQHGAPERRSRSGSRTREHDEEMLPPSRTTVPAQGSPGSFATSTGRSHPRPLSSHTPSSVPHPQHHPRPASSHVPMMVSSPPASTSGPRPRLLPHPESFTHTERHDPRFHPYPHTGGRSESPHRPASSSSSAFPPAPLGSRPQARGDTAMSPPADSHPRHHQSFYSSHAPLHASHTRSHHPHESPQGSSYPVDGMRHKQRRGSSSSSGRGVGSHIAERDAEIQRDMQARLAEQHQLERERGRDTRTVRSDYAEQWDRPVAGSSSGHAVRPSAGSLGGPGVSSGGSMSHPQTPNGVLSGSPGAHVQLRSAPSPHPRPVSMSHTPQGQSHRHPHAHGQGSGLPFPPSFAGAGSSPEMMRRAISSPEDVMKGVTGGPGMAFPLGDPRYAPMSLVEEREKRKLHPPPSYSGRQGRAHAPGHGEAMVLDRPGDVEGVISPPPSLHQSSHRAHQSCLTSPPPPPSATSSEHPTPLLGPARPSSSSSTTFGSSGHPQTRRRGSGSPMLPPISISAPASASIANEDAEFRAMRMMRERSLSGGSASGGVGQQAGGKADGRERDRMDEAWDYQRPLSSGRLVHQHSQPQHQHSPPMTMKRERLSSSASQHQHASMVSPQQGKHQAQALPPSASTSRRHEHPHHHQIPQRHTGSLSPLQSLRTLPPIQTGSSVSVKPLSSSSATSTHTIHYAHQPSREDIHVHSSAQNHTSPTSREYEHRPVLPGMYESQAAYDREMLRRHNYRARSREDDGSEEPPLKRRRSSGSNSSVARADDVASHWGSAPSGHQVPQYGQQPQRPLHPQHQRSSESVGTRDGAASPPNRARLDSPSIVGSGTVISAREKDGTLRRPGSARQSIGRQKRSSTSRDRSPPYPPISSGDHRLHYDQQQHLSQAGLVGPGAGRSSSDSKVPSTLHEKPRDASPARARDAGRHEIPSPGLHHRHHHHHHHHTPSSSSSHTRPHSHGFASHLHPPQHQSTPQEIHISPAFSVKHEDDDTGLGYVSEPQRRAEPLRVVHIPEAEAPFIQQPQPPKRKDREEKQKAKEAKEKEKAEAGGKIGASSTSGTTSKRLIKSRENQAEKQPKVKNPVVAVPSSSSGFPPTSTTVKTNPGVVPPPVFAQTHPSKKPTKASRPSHPPSSGPATQDATGDDIVMALERELENSGLGVASATSPHGVPATRPRPAPPSTTKTIKTATITINPKPDPEDIVNSLVEDILDDVEVGKPPSQTAQLVTTAGPPSSSVHASVQSHHGAVPNAAPARSGSSDRVVDDLDLDLDMDDGKAARPDTPMEIDGADAADLLEGEVLGTSEDTTVPLDVEEEVEESEAGGDTDMDVDDELLSLLDGTPQKKPLGVGTASSTASSVAQSDENETSNRSVKGKPGTKASPKVKKQGAKTSKADGSAKGRAKATPMARVKNVAVPAAPAAPTQPKVPSPSSSPSPKKSRPTSPGLSSVLSDVPRSRSTSVAPGERASSSAPPDGDAPMDEEQEQEQEDDDRLYCICQSRYDENRVMIACDRCDEWYHTSCVSMPDLEVDLVDQFFCPRCIAAYPNLSLKTTYKPRCLRGLQHPNPASAAACHQPSRGAYSKYCSKSCGMKHMQSKINAWTDKGGKKEKLWDTVKTVKKRQGTVIAHSKPKDRSRTEISRASSSSPSPSQEATIIPSSLCSNDVTSLSGPLLTSNEYVALTNASSDAAVKKLNVLLDKVVKMRNELVSAMNVIIWREKLLDLAKERAERVGTCGWDQRLCLGDDEVEGDFGTSVLESYDVDRENEENGDGDDQGNEKMNGVLTDGADGEDDEVRHGDWWCPGVVKCQRHAGWQALRTKDLALEKHSKEQALVKLTTRERDIRRRIEDTIEQRQHLYARKRGGDLDGLTLNGVGAKSVLKASSGANGRKANGIATAEKQEKKRKTLDE